MDKEQQNARIHRCEGAVASFLYDAALADYGFHLQFLHSPVNFRIHGELLSFHFHLQ